MKNISLIVWGIVEIIKTWGEPNVSKQTKDELFMELIEWSNREQTKSIAKASGRSWDRWNILRKICDILAIWPTDIQILELEDWRRKNQKK